MIDTTYLGIEVASDRRAGGDVGFHNVTDYLYSLAVGQVRRVLVCLSNDHVPLMPNFSSVSLSRPHRD